MTTLQGKDVVVVLEVEADLIVEEKVPKGTLTLQKRKEPIGREVALIEAEGDAEIVVVLVEEVVEVDLASAVAVVVVAEAAEASAGSENLKDEVVAIARKLLFLF